MMPNKPYFQPDFFNKTTLVAKISSQNQPYYLIISFFNKVIRLIGLGLWATKVVLFGNKVENKVLWKHSTE
jgi:hypothetical protein